MTGSERVIVTDYLRWVDEAPRQRVDRARHTAPVPELQTVALADDDPWLRARCLAVLDHVANEASTHVFAAALRDPVVDVRGHAIHGLTCERCRSTEISVADVVPAVIDAFETETVAELRHRLVLVLMQFSGRSEAARSKLTDIAVGDPDTLLREAAKAAINVGHVRSRKALERLAKSRRAATARTDRARVGPS